MNECKMTPDELTAAGQALYGERWQSSLARDLRVSDRTVRRWLAGDAPIPEQAETIVRAVLVEHFDRMGGLIAFDLTPGERSICYSYTGTCFRYDDVGTLTELTPGVASPGELTLIRWGAKEKLRRHREGGAAKPLHGFMRGSVVIPPDVDLTAPTSDESFAAETGELHR